MMPVLLTFPPRSPGRLVAVAASAGGIQAVSALLTALPEDFGAPIVLVQHRSAASPGYLHQILTQRTRLRVREARDGDVPRGGCVYVAPPGRHLRVGPGAVLRLADDAPIQFARPAADALFRSVAECFGPGAVGVVLTGRGQDGAAGASEIRRRGGLVLVQDPATCAASSMPLAVLSGCGADFVLPVETLGHALVSLVMAPGVSAALFGVPLAIPA